MSFHVTTRWGGDESEPTEKRMREVLSELDVDDMEHSSVSLTHESEWSLGAYSGGLVIWENVDSDNAPRHLNGVSRQTLLELWLKLANGKISEIDSEAWLPGYEDPG